MMSRISTLVLAVLLSGCAGHKSTVAAPAQATNWRAIITESDRVRLRDWRESFTASIAAARKAGNGLSIDREGVLLDPDAALGNAAPPAGNYQCRVIKLGTQGKSLAAYTVFPNYRCILSAEGQMMSFAKLDGIQRPVGLIFADSPNRQIFLGTMMLGDETLALQYGRDKTRDMLGTVERIGTNRWRMLLPYPHFESLMDVIELIPDHQ